MQITSSTPDLENQVQVRSIDLDKAYQGDKFKKHCVKHKVLFTYKVLPHMENQQG